MQTMTKMGKTMGLITGILMALLGIGMLIWPVIMTLIGINLAILLIGVSGVVQIIQYFNEEKEERNGWLLACGILIMIASAVMLAQPGFSKMLSFSFVFGFCAFMNGFNQFASSAALKKVTGKGSGWMIFGGVMSLILGAFFCIYPLMTEVIAAYVYAIYAIVAGIWLVCYSLGRSASEDKENEDKGDSEI